MWTFLSSEKVTVDCKVEVMNSITDTSVSFQSSFLVKNFRANLTILGTFKMMDAEKKNNKFDAILLSNPGRQPYGYERLLFQTPDNKCGVFLVAIYGSKYKWYEMRVRSSSLAKTNFECVQHFERARIRHGKRRAVFTSKCQDILVARMK
ncbi:uncharacterized protein LOC142586864 [Dermacentor variabilis]|uniref:uncharacterized protein LOC142586864 n=1 Tax=Dermacentor variabilis TaxID=34621 RepID=UPI003F5C2013